MGSVVKSRGRAVVVLLGVLFAACSSEPAINTDPIPATTSVAPVAPTTTPPPTTTSPPETTPPTTASPTTTEPDTTEADIREAVDMFMGIISFNHNTGLPRSPEPKSVERWLTGSQLDRWTDVFETETALGRYWMGEFTYSVLEVVRGDETTAVVTACLRDSTTGFESDGTVFNSGDLLGTVEIIVSRLDDDWKVARFTNEGEECVV